MLLMCALLMTSSHSKERTLTLTAILFVDVPATQFTCAQLMEGGNKWELQNYIVGLIQTANSDYLAAAAKALSITPACESLAGGASRHQQQPRICSRTQHDGLLASSSLEGGVSGAKQPISVLTVWWPAALCLC